MSKNEKTLQADAEKNIAAAKKDVPSVPVKTSRDGQHQSATIVYDRDDSLPGSEKVFTHKEKVTVERDGADVSIRAESFGDDGKMHGVQPFVKASGKGVVTTNDQYTSEQRDDYGNFNGKALLSPRTQAEVKALVVGLLKDGKFDANEAARASDMTLDAPQKVTAEHSKADLDRMHKGRGF